MNYRLSPKARRNLSRIIPFGLIWLFTGWINMLVETAAMGTLNPDSPNIISLTPSVIVFASISVFMVGILVGAIEMIFIADLFKSRSLAAKVLLKLALYFGLMLFIVCISFPAAASIEMGVSILDPKVLDRFTKFLTSITFLSTMLQMASSTFLCIVYASISENLGHTVFINFLTGRYHRPREEERIFMFLDMKSSTTIAEALGHVRYFDLLQDYYSDLSNSIINNRGEVYQYIGDEVVITWKFTEGILNENCVRCFFDMKRALEKRHNYYQTKYGWVPEFKAGMHYGKVITGEIGALKKEIFFTGDVLNVTSRIQSLCSEYQVDLILSDDLFQQIKSGSDLAGSSLGEILLKGRAQPMQLVKIEGD